ncbi:MAG: primosomal protein N' [Acetobacter sp.]|nr:primosomal protein N' [Bacteroides sp.]MCM1340521.1 primosomal protein N' [Acetobacter sp.]MCM1433261.1 primosomal protein N' [Clostridiales bacterium]
MNRTVATVAVEKTFFNLESDYDYYVPEELEKNIKVGMIVTIPFGKANKKREGIVVKLYTAINSELKEIISLKSALPVLSEEMVSLALWLKERCFCTTYDCLKQMLPRGVGKIGNATSRMATILIENEEDLPKLTPKQRSVVNLLFDIGTAEVNEICEFCSVGISVLKNLEKYGIISIYDKEIYRMPYKSDSVEDSKEVKLSSQQQNAYDTYAKMLDGNGGTGLLFGVTGSGKTQVYLKLIDKAIAMQKDVIVLVPEISLTPQALSIFHKRYGRQVAVFHSALSLGERNDEYKRADRGEAKIVIGTRSAVFAPLHNLGLIIIDEEQENTYKSERTPRYSAKDVANFRCRYNNALLLLTSATPSLESYSNAIKGKYTLCEMSERYGDAKLPEVITVDMKEELKKGNKSPVSSVLRELISETLDENKQVILLINRRGYNTFISCNDCGHVITCPNCSISLTYHSYNNRLTCHYCGYSKYLDNICPECSGTNVRYSGYGTQRIEDELQAIFPEARILRMDADTTSRKFSHDKLFKAFSNHDYDILIGTQMVAKGLDFPDVNLVGVVNADNSLYDENYNSSERSFDLITQVIGRSGRRDSAGKAVIQTINPYNLTLEFAGNQDYKGFFESEIELRKSLIYPPYCDIYSASFTGDNENKTALSAKAFFDVLTEENQVVKEKIIILGPSPAKISKINKQYRYKLFIKCKNSKNIRNLLNKVLKRLYKIKEYKDVMVSIDLNPYDLN